VITYGNYIFFRFFNGKKLNLKYPSINLLPRTKFEISGLLWILHLQKLCNYSPTLPLVRLDVPHVLRVLQLQQNPKVLSIDLLRPAVTRVEHGQLADETKKNESNSSTGSKLHPQQLTQLL